jgi:GR25 family glycosyltransferase involved in LPS biosynthesis
MHILICHYTKLTDRRKHMENELKKINQPYSYKYIDNYDQENLNKNLIQKYFNNTEKEWINRTSFLKTNNNYKKLKRSEMSLILKHCNCYSFIISKKLQYAIILEDDVEISDIFLKNINEVLKDKRDWDIIWLGTEINHNIIMDDDSKIQKSFHPSSHYSWAYIISNNAAKKILRYIDQNKFTLPIDWELSWLAYKLNLNVFWFKKPIVNSNVFKSSIGHN